MKITLIFHSDQDSGAHYLNLHCGSNNNRIQNILEEINNPPNNDYLNYPT